MPIKLAYKTVLSFSLSLCILFIVCDAKAQRIRVIEAFASKEATRSAEPKWALELRSALEKKRARENANASSSSSGVSSTSLRVIIQYTDVKQPSRSREIMNAVRPGELSSPNSVRQSLESRGIEVTREMRASNAVRARIFEKDVETLLDDPNVKDVLIEQFYKRMEAPRQREGQSLFFSVSDIGADDLWDDGFTGAGQVVVILDDGIFVDHEVFADGKIIQEACFSSANSEEGDISLCPNGGDSQIGSGAASDCPEGKGACFHGTHVASIAAGNDPDSFFANDGVAFDANVIAVQVFTEVTSTEICDEAPCLLASSLDIFEALDWIKSVSSQYNLAAVNMSLGGGEYFSHCPESPLDDIINDLRDLEILTTIASGNEGFVGAVGHPGCVESAITVSATNIFFPASWANHSATVDLLAPGTSINAAYSAPDTYENLDGTSMAAPHVAGAIALLRSVDPSASADQVAFALRASGDKQSRFGWDWETPFIDIAAAVSRLDDSAPPTGTRLLSIVSSGDQSGTLSYLRIYNSELFTDEVRVTLIDDQSGESLGTFEADIRGDASLQFQISEIEANLFVDTNGKTSYTAVVDSDFDGYAQHVVWNPGGASLTNVTSCLSGVTSTQSELINVHTTRIPAGYPSFIFIHNGGDDPSEAEFRMYEASDGSFIGAASTAEIAASTTAVYEAQEFLDAVDYSPGENENHVNFILQSGFNGSVAHVVNNTGSGVITNMSDKCVIN